MKFIQISSQNYDKATKCFHFDFDILNFFYVTSSLFSLLIVVVINTLECQINALPPACYVLFTPSAYLDPPSVCLLFQIFFYSPVPKLTIFLRGANLSGVFVHISKQVLCSKYFFYR